MQRAVPDVKWLVVDQQADDLAVGDVDDGLARLGISVSRLGVRQRDGLEDGIEVRPHHGMRLAFVQVGAPADVSVREREDRLGLGHQLAIEARLRDLPRVAPEAIVADHRSISSERSVTTMPAPCRRSASPWPMRSTPTTRPKAPVRPASTPASA